MHLKILVPAGICHSGSCLVNISRFSILPLQNFMFRKHALQFAETLFPLLQLFQLPRKLFQVRVRIRESLQFFFAAF